MEPQIFKTFFNKKTEVGLIKNETVYNTSFNE